jgi:hypothetical protein
VVGEEVRCTKLRVRWAARLAIVGQCGKGIGLVPDGDGSVKPSRARRATRKGSGWSGSPGFQRVFGRRRPVISFIISLYSFKLFFCLQCFCRFGVRCSIFFVLATVLGFGLARFYND